MRKKINVLLSGLIALLSGCNSPKNVIQANEVIALYGVPYATYNLRGQVIGHKNKPIKGAPIVIKGYKNETISDTLYTDKKGQFEATISAFPTQEINIVVLDPISRQPIDSTQHATNYTKKQVGRGFYQGECNIQTEIKVK